MTWLASPWIQGFISFLGATVLAVCAFKLASWAAFQYYLKTEPHGDGQTEIDIFATGVVAFVLVEVVSSWLNQVERWFAEITRKRIRRGTFRSVRELTKAIHEYIRIYNRNPQPFQWVASASRIIRKVNKYRQRSLSGSDDLAFDITNDRGREAR